MFIRLAVVLTVAMVGIALVVHVVATLATKQLVKIPLEAGFTEAAAAAPPWVKVGGVLLIVLALIGVHDASQRAADQTAECNRRLNAAQESGAAARSAADLRAVADALEETAAHCRVASP